ncbi:MAG: AI-2E family transporter [Ferruginibacter sp.]
MTTKYPFYLKSTIILLGIVLLVHILSGLQDIIVPLAFALLLSLLLNPLSDWFQRKKIPHILSILLSMFIALIIIVGIVYFISLQMTNFADEWPQLQKKSLQMFADFQRWAKSSLGLTFQKQQQYINSAIDSLKSLVAHSVGTVLDSLSIMALLPVYTFLFLYYKKLILNFLFEVFKDKSSEEVHVVLKQTKSAVQNYMGGLLIEGFIVAVLNSIALLLIGVKYAILLGVLGAILNVLPYIGGILAILFPVVIATVTKDGIHTQLAIVVAYIIIQFIDNHFLIPVIVSSRVRINALISIVVVLLGGALWGLSGMFLSIPFTGVIKILFDRIPELQPWGKLLGSEIATDHKPERVPKLKKVISK